MFRESINEIVINTSQHPVVWIDPYENSFIRNISTVLEITNALQDVYREQSPIEVQKSGKNCGR